MATGFNPPSPYNINLPANPTFQTEDQELKVEFERIYAALKFMSTHLVPPSVAIGDVLTDQGPGVVPIFAPGGGGTADIWTHALYGGI